jgi:micrococcal nuclease
MYRYKVKTVDKVVDGDTVDVTIDLGFDILHKIRVRLYGINTPESRTRDLEEKKRGLAAKDRLYELIMSCFIDDNFLILETKEKGKFGRYLGNLIRKTKEDTPELNLNQQLVTEGHAVDYFGGKR